MPEGPHCLLCKHHQACVLPQREAGQICGWYNAQVSRLIKRERPKHKLKALSSG